MRELTERKGEPGGKRSNEMEAGRRVWKMKKDKMNADEGGDEEGRYDRARRRKKMKQRRESIQIEFSKRGRCWLRARGRAVRIVTKADSTIVQCIPIGFNNPNPFSKQIL